jgi:lysophospholipase L1-like esterase
MAPSRRRRLAGIVVAAGIAIASGLVGPATPAHAAESNGGVRIMPLGASITDGYNVPGGFRINLWRSLVADGRVVDFVGSKSNGPAELGDHDHEGHSGWRIDQIDANVDAWFAATAPRTVLLHVGTNDMNQNYDVANAPARLSALIDHMFAAAPGVELFVAQITPESDPTREARVTAYNAAIPGVVAGKGSHAHLVDMHSAVSTADLADGVHPTRAGYDKMAAAWYAALNAVPASLQAPSPPAVTVDTWHSLRVTTPGYTNRYLRHKDGLGYTEVVTATSDDLLKKDATWKIVPGLASAACYSFESRNFPGEYLRHQNSRVRRDTNDSSALFVADATWCPRAASGGVRLAGYNYPGSFLRHIGGELWLATPGGTNAWDNPATFVADTTWSIDQPWVA